MQCHLIIFNLGSVRDKRLHRMFLNNKVRVTRPEQDRDDWFNIFVIHQVGFSSHFNDYSSFYILSISYFKLDEIPPATGTIINVGGVVK